jgi:hypothetical protein
MRHSLLLAAALHKELRAKRKKHEPDEKELGKWLSMGSRARTTTLRTLHRRREVKKS